MFKTGLKNVSDILLSIKVNFDCVGSGGNIFTYFFLGLEILEPLSS